ncbi:alpha/beta hydrolase domain-containing protein [Pusillimonas sp. T7-7]|uniref:alpha/beta hydrolase n=1 Tax=Pusillimonas sp. (strain T7-7) TaxID=1007105 RepID=UPI00020855D7|nr:alpha/beta hydrolase [Pusillimonas sp. T7-7]AEC21991.1 alpha/beta hydrolase domain-containing protein [Pusillimonas sp. T7-7]
MRLDKSAQALIDFTRQQGNPPLGQVPVEQSRAESNAVRAQLQPDPPVLASVEDGMISGPGADIPFRIYRADMASSSAPAVIFFHGGGFVMGDLDSHDIVCRQICKESACTVIAIDYRRAPEHRFPAAVDDAIHAAAWLREQAAEFGIDADRIALAGDSAGANLATVVAIDMKRNGLQPLALQILFYPVTDQHADYDSKQRFANGYLLTRSAIGFYAEQYFENESDKQDWRASPIRQEDLSGLPEALVITAGFDPLVDEGEAYALRLAQAGVRTTLRRFPGQVHGFVTRGRIVPEAFDAIQEAALLLRTRFA